MSTPHLIITHRIQYNQKPLHHCLHHNKSQFSHNTYNNIFRNLHQSRSFFCMVSRPNYYHSTSVDEPFQILKRIKHYPHLTKPTSYSYQKHHFTHRSQYQPPTSSTTTYKVIFTLNTNIKSTYSYQYTQYHIYTSILPTIYT